MTSTLIAPVETPAPEPAPRPRRGLKPLAGVLAVLAAAAAGLWRSRPPGALDSLWAEDGQEFLSDALNRPWYEPLATPLNGYFHTVARACFALIALAPVSWAAALNACAAALITAAGALVVHVAARSRLAGRGRAGMFAAAVIAGTAAVPMGFVPDALAQVQFPLVYAGLWALLWRPAGSAGRVVAAALPALAVLNSMLGLLLVPVALLRLGLRRDRDAAYRALALLPGALLQVVPWLTGGVTRGLGERHDTHPLSVAALYVRWGLPRSFLGDVWLSPPVVDPAAHLALMCAGLAVPMLLLLAGLCRWTRPEWRLAGLLAGFGCAAGVFELAVHGQPEGRYLVLITLPNMAAAVLLALPGGRLGTVPFVALATLLAVVCVANLRPGGYQDGLPSWHRTVAQAAAQCRADRRLTWVTVHTAQWPYYGWQAVLPCDRLR